MYTKFTNFGPHVQKTEPEFWPRKFFLMLISRVITGDAH